MGRKAKLKKIRREFASQEGSPSPQEKDSDPTQFVKQLQRKGYQLDKIKRSPDVPADKIEPIV